MHKSLLFPCVVAAAYAQSLPIEPVCGEAKHSGEEQEENPAGAAQGEKETALLALISAQSATACTWKACRAEKFTIVGRGPGCWQQVFDWDPKAVRQPGSTPLENALTDHTWATDSSGTHTHAGTSSLPATDSQGQMKPELEISFFPAHRDKKEVYFPNTFTIEPLSYEWSSCRKQAWDKIPFPDTATISAAEASRGELSGPFDASPSSLQRLTKAELRLLPNFKVILEAFPEGLVDHIVALSPAGGKRTIVGRENVKVSATACTWKACSFNPFTIVGQGRDCWKQVFDWDSGAVRSGTQGLEIALSEYTYATDPEKIISGQMKDEMEISVLPAHWDGDYFPNTFKIEPRSYEWSSCSEQGWDKIPFPDTATISAAEASRGELSGPLTEAELRLLPNFKVILEAFPGSEIVDHIVAL